MATKSVLIVTAMDLLYKSRLTSALNVQVVELSERRRPQLTKKNLPVKSVVVVFECEDCGKTKKLDLSVAIYNSPQCCSMPMQIIHTIVEVD